MSSNISIKGKRNGSMRKNSQFLNPINKKSKLKKLNSNLNSKLKDLLKNVENHEKIENIPYNPNKENYSNKDIAIIVPKNNDIVLPKINPSNNSMNNNPKKQKNENENITDLKAAKKKLKKLKKGSFMTGVGLIKTKKPQESKTPLENDPVLININNQINSMLHNIDDIDEMDKESKVKSTMSHLKDSADFMQLVKEIDDYRDEIHEEFDEVKYLIKFADNTHKLIDRHKNVMTHIFRGAGLRARGLENESKKNLGKIDIDKINKDDDNDFDNQPYYKNGYYYRKADEDLDLGGVFDKLKAINKVKDNLSNIQDDFLGYHQNLKTKMKEKNKGFK